MQRLFYQITGSGRPLLIVHGLFGSSDNWRAVTKALSDKRQIIAVDLRNHGRSFHHQDQHYPQMAEDIERVVDELGIEEIDLLGHSIGGKVAMQFARQHTHRVRQMVVVDIAPRQYPDKHSWIFKSLLSLNLDQYQQRSQLDDVLASDIKDAAVRQFLLMNVKKNDQGSLRWRINLQALFCNYAALLSSVEPEQALDVKSCFIAGGRSDYISEADKQLIRQCFPDSEFTVIDEAGHWVHAEAPKAFCQVVEQFLDD
ncbi:MAG: alpha/beta fold hydrolase [Methylophaga sp.]|nr:alpha/beta fold hydrolase [Methylophaga sp.]